MIKFFYSVFDKTALHKAVKKGDIAQVKNLINEKLPLDEMDEKGCTPLHCAADIGNIEMAKLLLAAGANVEARAKGLALWGEGLTPLAVAVNEGYVEVVQLLLQYKANADGLMYAAAFNGHLKVVEILLAAGVNPKGGLSGALGSNRDGRWYPHIEMAKILLAAGADPNDGWQSAISAEHSQPGLVQLLINHHADLNYKIFEGNTPLHYAVYAYNKEIVCLLLEYGANRQIQNNKGLTPLDLAAKDEDEYKLAKHVAQLLREYYPPLKAKVVPNVWPPANAVKPTVLPATSLTISHTALTIGEEVGRGGFGIVYKGSWQGNTVAVKQFYTALSMNGAKVLQQEMAIMINLRFPQIVQLYGVCLDKSPYCLVMEYMPKGSLYQVLHNFNEVLPWSEREQMARDIVNGLAYLHQRHILHRDLKSLNVLVDQHNHAKLTDFGLATVKAETASITTMAQPKVVGTYAWMAPEIIGAYSPAYSTKSDMYSCAIVLWEIATRTLPFKTARGDYQIIKDWIIKGTREPIPSETPPRVAKLIQWGWAAKPEDRPTAEQAMQALQSGASSGKEEVASPMASAYLSNTYSLP